MSDSRRVGLMDVSDVVCCELVSGGVAVVIGDNVVGVVVASWLVVVVMAVAGVVIVGVAGWLVVVVVGAFVVVDGGGVTVTVGLLFGPVVVTVCDVGGGTGSAVIVSGGLFLLWPKFTVSNAAASTTAPAAPTLNTRAVHLYHRIYHGSGAISVA
ncbi:hypothetical protein [Mycobacterium uberis]|uniref:hypothetical protein n=1 Tax=Mycobacterium uberis TaxID=2162698 RepID=UPI001058D2E8|nr:hypothetical protein [Mycobacterium uberis]